MSTLRDLHARFLKRTDDRHFQNVDSLTDADGICFLCPVCFEANRGSRGTHSIICWSPNVPQTTSPTPGRWSMQGTGIDDLTLVAGSSSVSLTDAPCKAHFFVQGGKIVKC